MLVDSVVPLVRSKGGSTASRETSVQEAFGLFFSRLAMDILTLHAIDQPVEYV